MIEQCDNTSYPIIISEEVFNYMVDCIRSNTILPVLQTNEQVEALHQISSLFANKEDI